MTTRRLAPLLVLAAALVGGGLYLSRSADADPAPLPEDLEQITPSSEFLNVEASIAYYREVLRRQPEAVEPRVRLAQALMQHARGAGEPTELLPEARTLLDEALAREPDHYYGRTIKASLLNTFHRFEEARDLAREMLADYPEHAFVWGVLVDALVEMGEYDEAVAASDSMLAIRPGLPSYSRASYIRELYGDTEGAIEAMELAAQAEPAGRPSRSWALHTLAGLYLGDAQYDTAQQAYEGILLEDADFVPAMAGLGHVALARGDAAEAVRLLEEARALQPMEMIDELLVEAYEMAGEPDKATGAAERVHRALLDAREMGEIVDMEEADFLIDQGERLSDALRMAREQQARRPGHLHANETLAWALHHTDASDQAIPYIERAMRLGTGDAMVLYRAGRIYEGAGDTARAAALLREALDGHLHVESPSAAAEAEAVLARLPNA